MGHPNLGVKTPSKTQNTIWQPSQRPPGAVPSSMLGCPNPLQVKVPSRCLAIIYAWTPKSSPGVKKPKYALGPRPNTKVRLVRGLTSRRATSALLEASPPRPPAARCIFASPEGMGLTLGEREQSPPRPRVKGHPRRASELPPRPSPPQGLGAGGTPPRLRPPRQTGTVTHPLDGTSAFIANHSAAWCGCQTVSAATPHNGRDRSPVRQLKSLCHHPRLCANLPCAVRT